MAMTLANQILSMFVLLAVVPSTVANSLASGRRSEAVVTEVREFRPKSFPIFPDNPGFFPQNPQFGATSGWCLITSYDLDRIFLFVEQVNSTEALLHPLQCTGERKVEVVFDIATIPAFLAVAVILLAVL